MYDVDDVNIGCDDDNADVRRVTKVSRRVGRLQEREKAARRSSCWSK